MTEENKEIETDKEKKHSKCRIFASCFCVLLLFISIFCCACGNKEENETNVGLKPNLQSENIYSITKEKYIETQVDIFNSIKKFEYYIKDKYLNNKFAENDYIEFPIVEWDIKEIKKTQIQRGLFTQAISLKNGKVLLNLGQKNKVPAEIFNYKNKKFHILDILDHHIGESYSFMPNGDIIYANDMGDLVLFDPQKEFFKTIKLKIPEIKQDYKKCLIKVINENTVTVAANDLSWIAKINIKDNSYKIFHPNLQIKNRYVFLISQDIILYKENNFIYEYNIDDNSISLKYEIKSQKKSLPIYINNKIVILQLESGSRFANPVADMEIVDIHDNYSHQIIQYVPESFITGKIIQQDNMLISSKGGIYDSENDTFYVPSDFNQEAYRISDNNSSTIAAINKNIFLLSGSQLIKTEANSYIFKIRKIKKNKHIKIVLNKRKD